MPITPFTNKDITVFAETNFRNQRKKFGIKRADRKRHMYVIGKTGMGKTMLLANMMVQDIRAKEGVLIVDTGGAIAEQILQHVPESRVKDVVYFNPMDREYPFAFNFLDGIHANDIYAFADGILPLFQELWSDVWGPRFEYVFKNALVSLLQYGNATILHLLPLLTDERFRAEVVSRLNDPVLIDFWEKEFSEFPDRFLETAVSPLQDKMGQIISNPMLRNIIGQRTSSFKFSDLIDNKKIVILLLNKNEIGADIVKFLGGAFVLRLLIEANKHKKEERDFYIYLDEFQYSAMYLFVEFLSKSDYGMNFIVSNQYLSQIPESLRQALTASVGTFVVFRVSAPDAQFIAEEFGNDVSAELLTRLAPYAMIVRLMIDGEVYAPFSAVALEPLPKIGLKEKIVGYSREQYARNRLEVERSIAESLKITNISPLVNVGRKRGSSIAHSTEHLEEFRKAHAAQTVAETVDVKNDHIPTEELNSRDRDEEEQDLVSFVESDKKESGATTKLTSLAPGDEVLV